jgi:hypothetical protein
MSTPRQPDANWCDEHGAEANICTACQARKTDLT